MMVRSELASTDVWEIRAKPGLPVLDVDNLRLFLARFY